MAGIIERLTEGVINRDMRAEGHALLKKWERTGLLEGLNSTRQKEAMSRLLENQAKELLRESSSMAAGDVEGFAAVAFPIVRRVFAGLIANDLVSVQPMSLPSGLIFFLDFVFSPNIGNTTMSNRLGNPADKSIYGTDEVGSQVTGGVDLLGSLEQDLGGPRTVGARGYAYASPTGSNSALIVNQFIGFDLDTATENQKKRYLVYDPDILALSGSGTSYAVGVMTIPAAKLTGSTNGNEVDYEVLGAISASRGGGAAGTGPSEIVGIGTAAQQIRRLTQHTGSDVQMVFFALSSSGPGTGISPDALNVIAAAANTTLGVVFPIKDKFEGAGALGSIRGATLWGLEGNDQIPEIDIKVDSIAVTAMTKKLKAKWTPELGQDLNAYHNLDAEVELTSILSEQIALEIDREILGDLVNGAKAATYYWSRSPGLFLNRVTGAEIGAASAAPDFTGTVSEWYETLAETINDVSAQIHRKTLRGGANFVVCGPEVANILEFTAGFRASVTHDDEVGSIGAVKVGSLSKKFDVIVDPYFLRNVILVGRRGKSFLESGYVYAPYVPLQTTPTIFGPEDFVPRKGVMTRYAKKMVRPDMYGIVVVRGLLGEAGATG